MLEQWRNVFSGPPPARGVPLCARVQLSLALLLALLPSAYGALVIDKTVVVTQPDGTKLEAHCWGDEYYVVAESADGYTLIYDPQTRFVCYAQLSEDGNDLVSTGIVPGQGSSVALGLSQHIRIKPEARRAKVLKARATLAIQGLGQPVPPAPRTGNVRGICLLVDFPDEPGIFDPAEVDDLCNQQGYTGFGNHGSIRDYYFDVSDGALTLTHFVSGEYYQASLPKSHYTDPGWPWGVRARDLVIEALNDLDARGLDFSQFDADHDGVVDAVSCYYAGGPESAWATGLWPGHLPMGFACVVGFSWCADGVRVDSFQITDMGTEPRIGTFCHELGHLLMDWPDLYDYDHDSSGAGDFCLMASGDHLDDSRDPTEPCPYLKMTAGWADVTVLTNSQSPLTAVGGVNRIFQIPHPTETNEFYLIENRTSDRSQSQFDGLAIWHIDERGDNSDQDMSPGSHYLATLVQADGEWHLERNLNRGDEWDLYKENNNSACTLFTHPNTHWWSGDPSAIFIENIGAAGPSMTFDFRYMPGVWVDFAYTGGEAGTFSQPFNTLSEGLAWSSPGGHVWIKSGSSAERLVIAQIVTLHGYGAVTIGQ